MFVYEEGVANPEAKRRLYALFYSISYKGLSIHGVLEPMPCRYREMTIVKVCSSQIAHGSSMGVREDSVPLTSRCLRVTCNDHIGRTLKVG